MSKDITDSANKPSQYDATAETVGKKGKGPLPSDCATDSDNPANGITGNAGKWSPLKSPGKGK